MKNITITIPQQTLARINDARSVHTMERVLVVQAEEAVVSDGFHTFEELYDHRFTLFIALARIENKKDEDAKRYFISQLERAFQDNDWVRKVWRSKCHDDGKLCFGTGTQYVLGIGKEPGAQITYHIPIERWDETDFAETLEVAPEWDKHTSADVLERLKKL